MHPESAAGLHFALHHPDKFLAFFGSDGDTLHWRPSLWWLDGCGVFTMPQGTVDCSIILCTYLASPQRSALILREDCYNVVTRAPTVGNDCVLYPTASEREECMLALCSSGYSQRWRWEAPWRSIGGCTY